MLSGRRPLFAVVQRRKDDGWVLPKGKLKPKENAITAARREVVEETGHNVEVHEFLGAISYRTGSRPKVVCFWWMLATKDALRDPAPDISAVEWLPLNAAITRLTQPLERVFLTQIGARAIKNARLSMRLTAVARKSTSRRKPTPRAKGTVSVSTPPIALNLFGRLFGRLRQESLH